MTDRYYLTDGSHVYLTGATGAGEKFGGKTVLLNWWINEAVKNGWHDIGVIFNPKGHRFIRGTRVQSLQGLAQSYQAGKRRFNYVPRGDTTAAHTRLCETLQNLPGTKVVGHDEAHEYAESDLLDWMFRQGGNVQDSERFPTGDIRSIAASQHPWDLPEGVTNNVPLFVYIGPKSPQAKRYFDTMQISAAYEQIPDDVPAYHWSVVDAGEYLHTNPPAPGEYAP